MKTYFIAGDLYDNYKDYNCIGPFSRIIEASNAIEAWNEVMIEIESDGLLVLVKDIKVVE
ncbi:hypothetical protein CPL00134L_CDS0027 [Escherichia phage Phagiculus]